MVKRLAASTCVVLCATAAGCDVLTSSFRTNEFSGDPYPILVENTTGALVVGVREAGSDADRIAVLDVMSPWTLIDRGPDVEQSIDSTTLTLMGARMPGGELTLPRAAFVDKRILNLHPCDLSVQECTVGPAGGERPFSALVGLDSFGGDALRLRLSSDEIFVLPDIAGDDIRRGRSCDAVFPSPFRGGGTLVIGGTEVSFASWRIAIDACIQPSPKRLLAQSARGANAMFVVSTGIGVSMLTVTAYQRYRELDVINIPPVEMLPEVAVSLPSGPIVGNAGTIPSIALVGNSSGNPRAPCRQMWASHLLAARDCEPGDDCPCTDGKKFCGVPGLVELAPAGGIPILVVPDNDRTIQALRTELRPDRPDVDGILGTDALHLLELDLDVPHDRLLARCVDRTLCGARAALPDAEPEARSYVNGCLGSLPGPFTLED